jgi:phosphopentomutase
VSHGRFVIIVLDGVGIGELPDAAKYGDVGSNSIGNLAHAIGGLKLPNLEKMGLGNIAPIEGVAPSASPTASFGKSAERSEGKDTITGHWEMMGVVLSKPLALFHQGFPREIIEPFIVQTNCGGILGNKAASGTEILKELGRYHEETGYPIVYTSADSVFQIAAHEQVTGLETLYRWCEIARKILDPYQVARVIARPFVGHDGQYQRTYNRRDFAMLPPERTVLDMLVAKGVPVIGVGKIPDIYTHQGITEEVHTEGNTDGLKKTAEILQRAEGLLFVNLVDTDMLYGHRNDVPGYARALEEFDRAIPSLLAGLRPGDVLAIIADHGNDPTTPSTDHSREYVPLIVFNPSKPRGADLGVRKSMSDLGQTVAEFFGVGPHAQGESFLRSVT